MLLSFLFNTSARASSTSSKFMYDLIKLMNTRAFSFFLQVCSKCVIPHVKWKAPINSCISSPEEDITVPESRDVLLNESWLLEVLGDDSGP